MSPEIISHMKKLFRQAAEIAQQVPDNMQAAAFNRALDMLREEHAPLPETTTDEDKSAEPEPRADARAAKEAKEFQVGLLMKAADSKRYPEVASTGKVLDEALMILQIASRDHGIDGLTPSEISRLLTEKFRVSTTSAAINRALGASPALVHRVRRGQMFEYKLLRAGEHYLSGLTKTGGLPEKRPHKSSRGSAAAASSNGLGPKQILRDLIAEGYFASPRRVSEIVGRIREKHAKDYKSANLSSALVRLQREDALKRTKNARGRYEYFVP